MRIKYIELPSLKELEETLATESQRAIPKEKASMHYASLEPFITFLNTLGIDTSEITLDKTWQDVRMISERLINEASPRILESDRSEISIPAYKLYEYLSEEDSPDKSDLIIAFGAKTNARVEKAIELYKKRLSTILLFSGSSPLYANIEPEAEVYKEIALKVGIPEDDIITETKSITVADNVRSSLNLLDEMHITYKNIIIVNSPYTQRRSYSHLEKYTPTGTKIYRVNCTTKEGLRKNDWFTN